MQNRIFELLETVAKNGPITLDQLSGRTGISRSATFRGLKRLEEGGWIRLRLNGRQYVLTSRVEQRLNTKVEPKPEIEQLTPIIAESIDLKTIRVRIFQQETTTSIALVDDSEYNSMERIDHSMAFECGEFVICALQMAGYAVGKVKLDALHTEKAKILIDKFETSNFAAVSEQQFLWLPLFSQNSEVFLLCLSSRDLSQIDGQVAKTLLRHLDVHYNSLCLQVYGQYKFFNMKQGSVG